MQRRVNEVERHLFWGSRELLEHLLTITHGGSVINTGHIERQDASFRASFTTLVRRSSTVARTIPTLTPGINLVGSVYNLCRYQDSLAIEPTLPCGRPWPRRTPAIPELLSALEG
jgi:hypothetical protein